MRNKWEGVFTEDSKIMLTPSHLSVCVSSLQDVKLFNSNLDVVDEAFEYLIGKSSKGEKGQYFTPRYVIDMCVKMMNPQKEESVIDTASGIFLFTLFFTFGNKFLKKKEYLKVIYLQQKKNQRNVQIMFKTKFSLLILMKRQFV